ncbi:Calx-beta domain-containing protein, partial [Pedobacter sandarakinus]|uniref:Calx-beta domain-containing protein n=1 Tax=Pedobacter sandarakinus TaxID=353156 RepID=UPI0022472F97
VVEGTETVVLTFNSATNNPSVTVSPASATVNIADDDVMSVVLSGASSVVEGNSGATIVTYTATLTGVAGTTIRDASTVTPVVTAGTATLGSDYNFTSPGALTFAAGSAVGATRTFTVSITGDNTIEPDETYTAAITAATGNLTLGTPSSITTTITNDDSATISVATTDAS